jgi:hypothetical protein
LRLVAFTDMGGYLEPCGCQTRPLGGIDRAGQRLRELSSDGVPTLVLSAGDLFFGGEPPPEHGAGTPHDAANAQAQWQAETLARAMQRLRLSVALPGPTDRRRGGRALRELMEVSGAAMLCPAPDVAQPEGCQPNVLVERGGIRVGLFGLATDAAGPADRASSGLLAAAKRHTEQLRTRGAGIVIGLIDGDGRAARRVAGTPGLDFLLHGGSNSAEVPPPERIGDATLVRAGHHGQGLLTIDLFKSATPGPFTDVSAWTQRAARAALERRSAELAAHIEEWRRDPEIDRARLAEQEARLSTLRRALQHEPVSRAAGSTFSAQYLELDDKTAADPELRALLVAHDRRVNEHNRVQLADVKPKPVPPGAPTYVGSERCGGCHDTEIAWWKQHAHGRAYTTLERVEKQFSLNCVSCHVTGYGQPGGAAVVQNAGLTHVGCESCHGPGSVHVSDPDGAAAKNVRREVPEATCRQCHDGEHSDQFDYARYRARLLVPGHGKPALEER